MSCPEFRKTIQMYYINLFQETHLRPHQHDTIDLPPGYSILSRTRRPKVSFDQSWGGVAIVYRSELKLKPREDLSGPDFLVIQLGNILIYNVYIYPESTQWAGVLENDPCEALAASLALAFTAHFLVALLGDLNARTAEMLANLLDPPRTSMDKETRTTRNSCTYSRTINKMRL
jgi:exonuclease III